MVYRLAVRTTVAVRATPTPTPLLMRRMMPVRLPADDLRRIAVCPLKKRWMPQLCGSRRKWLSRDVGLLCPSQTLAQHAVRVHASDVHIASTTG